MKRAENQPVATSMALYGGIFAKAYTVPDEGTLLPQHAHETPHITALTAGSVQVWCGDANLGVFHAPAFIKVAAGVFHRFLTLTSNTSLMCIHASETEDVPIAADGSLALED